MQHYLGFLTRALAHSPDNRMPVRALAIMLYVAQSPKAVLSRTLAADLNLPKPTVSRLTRHLSAIGLLNKARGTKDLRDCWLELSDAGKAFVAALDDPHAMAA